MMNANADACLTDESYELRTKSHVLGELVPKVFQQIYIATTKISLLMLIQDGNCDI